MVREQVGDKETERYFCSEEGRGDCYLRVIFFLSFLHDFWSQSAAKNSSFRHFPSELQLQLFTESVCGLFLLS